MADVVTAPPVRRTMLGRGSSVVDGFIVAAITIAAIYTSGSVLAPLALAVILAFILTPPIQWLRRRKVPRITATVTVVVVFLAAAIGIGAVLTTQVASLAEDLPRYQQTLQDKIRDLRGSGLASKSMMRAGQALSELQTELTKDNSPAPDATVAVPAQLPPAVTTTLPANTPRSAATPITPPRDAETGPGETPERAPIPVEIRNPADTPFDQLKSILSILLKPLTATGLVLLFLIFILLQREDVRDRAIRLLGTNELGRSTAALNESAHRLSRYLLAQTIANAGFGAVIGTSLWIIGVPSPLLWGILAALMRFVPFIGSVIAAVFPVILAASVDPGWTMVATTVALFVIAEPIMGHIIDPMIQGRATGMTPLAVILSTVFWTMMWGPIGLVLAVPLTLVLVVFGKHIKQLEFFNILLGDDEPLSAQHSFYQRLLSGDADEAAGHAERRTEDQDLAGYLDEVVLPSLVMAAADLDAGAFDQSRAQIIDTTVANMLDNLQAASTAASVADTDEPVAPTAPGVKIFCIAARTPIDMAGARVVAYLLREHGADAVAITEAELPRDAPANAPTVISDFSDKAQSSRIDFMVRRLKRRLGSPPIMVGKWRADLKDAVAALPTVPGSTIKIVSRLSEVKTAAIGAARNEQTIADQAA